MTTAWTAVDVILFLDAELTNLCKNVFQYVFHRICHVGRIVRDSGSCIGHGIAGAGKLEHLDVIILISESNTFFRFYLE